MCNVAILVAAALGLCPAFLQAAVAISASEPSVDAGSPVTLTWTTAADGAFISGVGRVDGSGSLTLTPRESTDYILVASESGTLNSARARVAVRGTRGGTTYPDVDEFREVRSTGERAGTTFDEYAGRVYKALESAGFAVRGDLLPGRPYWLFYTDYRARPEILRPVDRGIRLREVAYGVRIYDKSNGRVFYEITALVRYQRLAEAQHRPETEVEVIQLAVGKVRNLLESL